MLHYRLSPFLSECIHDSQYSTPGKKDWEINSLLRDIFQEMHHQETDSFLLAVDFRKAFDSIFPHFLYQVMDKMGFPAKFIDLITLFDTDATANVLINGALSEIIDIKRGSRQGDPLSMDKFIMAMDPLLRALNQNANITKYKSFCSQEFLTLAKADDLNVVVHFLTSLFYVRHDIMRFQLASGLEMNVNKTKGLFFNKSNMHSVHNLPFNTWNEDIVILGIPYGSKQFIKKFWDEKYLSFAKETSFFQSYNYMTLQAKTIISKSKLMPKISYLGSVLPTPKDVKNKIDERLIRFVIPHNKTSLKVKDLCAKRSMGGISLANINLHCDVMLIRSIMSYLKQKVDGNTLSPSQRYIEYHLGHKLSRLWGLPFCNSQVHAFHPNEFYTHIFEIMKRLKSFGIELDHLLLCKVKVKVAVI